eukprot:COSAG04_NODE_169_length_21636_cov_32.919023_18_plen_410_part_00
MGVASTPRAPIPKRLSPVLVLLLSLSPVRTAAPAPAPAAPTLHPTPLLPAAQRAALAPWLAAIGSNASGYPFAFILENTSSDALLPQWNFTSRTNADTSRTLRWWQPSENGGWWQQALAVEVRLQLHGATADWTLTLLNEGDGPTPTLSDLRSLRADWETTAGPAGPRLFSHGGLMHGFEPMPPTPLGSDPTQLVSDRGTSSFLWLPYMQLEWPSAAGGGRGLSISVGWSGDWHASFSDVSASVGVGLPAGIALQLAPGESVRGARILTLSYSVSAAEAAGSATAAPINLHERGLNAHRQVIRPIGAEGLDRRGPPGLVPAVSWPWVPTWGSLQPPRRDGENAQKTGKNGDKMGEIRPKTCEGRGLTKDQLAARTPKPGATRRRHAGPALAVARERSGLPAVRRDLRSK